jgi:polysaccharide export outer membrane protein
MNNLNLDLLQSFSRIALAVWLGMVGLSLGVFAQDATVPEAPAEESKPISDRIAPASAGVDPNSYKVGAGDQIGIFVWREPELTMRQTVRPDGKISMPLIGDVVVDGRTPNDIREQLSTMLKEYVLNPSIMVEVLAVRSKKFTVTGEVGRPGSYPLTGPTTVLDALTNAGGFRDFANKKKVTILRGSETFKFNYNDVIKGKNREQNIELMDGDLVVVP